MEEKIKIDYDKAASLCERVLSSMYSGLPPFHTSTEFPDAIVPKGISQGSIEHALYLFHGVSLDSRKQADEVYKTMRKIFEQLDGDLKQLANMSRTEVTELLEPHFGISVRYPKNPSSDLVRILRENAMKLQSEHNGNPLLLLAPKDIQKTLENVAEYRDYGIPKAALLMKNYVKFSMWPFSKTDIPIKVDRHVMRISLGNGVISADSMLRTVRKGEKMPRALILAINQGIRIGYFTEQDYKEGIRTLRTDKLVLPLTEVYRKICMEKGFSAIDLDDAFWLRGSRSCRKNDAVYCDTCCPVRCDTRYPSDNNAVWYFIDRDKRRHQDNLFTHLRKEKRLKFKI